MRYLNLLLILVIFGCYSGIHTSSFNIDKESTPTCHTNGSIQKVHHKLSKINFQINNNQQRQRCCINATKNQVDFESTFPILIASKINFPSLENSFKNNNLFRDNNLNNHSPPPIFISNSSFLI